MTVDTPSSRSAAGAMLHALCQLLCMASLLEQSASSAHSQPSATLTCSFGLDWNLWFHTPESSPVRLQL